MPANESRAAQELDPPHDYEGVIDLEEALAGVGDRLSLLTRIARTFLGECSGYQDNLRDAVRTGDNEMLTRTAHTLKGSVGIFAAKPAFDAASRLEQMGIEGEIEGVEEVHVQLEQHLERLKWALNVLLEKDAQAVP